MGIISNIKDRIADYADEQKEKRDFQKVVNKQTLPIRRGAYLKQKMANAIAEGKNIAHQEFEKQRAKEEQKKELKDFNIKEPVDQWKPTIKIEHNSKNGNQINKKR